MNKLLIFSDIHANLTALHAVLDDAFSKYQPDGLILLGDIINYGMRPNEVISLLTQTQCPILVNLIGNHEKALLDGDLSHFSTERGKYLLNYTSSILSDDSFSYIQRKMNPTAIFSIELSEKKYSLFMGILTIHIGENCLRTKYMIFVIVLMIMSFLGIPIYRII